MSAVKIEEIKTRPILDSRGEWTIEIQLKLENGLAARASVPQGRSRGRGEAITLPAEIAVQKIQSEIAPAIIGLELNEQSDLDNRLLELDGTADKSRLGANAMLAISLAAARTIAKTESLPLWRYLAQLANQTPRSPRLLANLINGGQHSGSNLQIQEFLIITPENEKIGKAISLIQNFYVILKNLLLEKRGPAAINLGDEGGFAPNLDNEETPFELFTRVSRGLDLKLDFGIDAAGASLPIYSNLATRFPLTYLEDPYPEDNLVAWHELKQTLGEKIIIVADDLTTTNEKIINSPGVSTAASGIIIKPNQIGTLTETLAAVAAARKLNWKIFVSHRSGETNDDFIADLAYGLGADGIKLGAPARGERIAKYNRLLEIEQEALEN